MKNKYAEPKDMINKFGQANLTKLTNDDPGIDCPDNKKLLVAISQAEADIDAQLGQCYVIPTCDNFPTILKYKTIDIAYYHLHVGCEMSETAKTNYDACLEWLTRLCCDECPIDIGLARKPGQDEIGVTTQDRIFTRENLAPYVYPRLAGSYRGDRNRECW